jgi:hypothetical protein
MVVKYSIIESDIWNFDKTGFLMDQIIFILIVISFNGRVKVKKI